MRSETAARNVAAYRAMNAEGFAWLLAACDRFGVPVERRDALLVADEQDSAQRIDDEHFVARRAGLGVEKVRGLGLPLPTFGGLRLPGPAVRRAAAPPAPPPPPGGDAGAP